MKNEKQKSDFTNLLIDTSAKISAIDKETEWQDYEPEWWVEMMELKRQIQTLLQKRTK